MLKFLEYSLYVAVDLLACKLVVVGAENKFERHALLALSDLCAAVNVKESYRGNILAGRRNSFLKSAAGDLLGANESQVAGLGSKLGDRSKADSRIEVL